MLADPGPEGGVDERRVRLDIGAHDDDVAWLESGVVAEQVQQALAEHLDLPGGSVAGVDHHGPVGLCRSGFGGAIVAEIGLQPAEERRRRPG